MNKATRDMEQIECSYREELDYPPPSTSEAALLISEDSGLRDTAHCRAALRRPVASPANEGAEITVKTDWKNSQRSRDFRNSAVC